MVGQLVGYDHYNFGAVLKTLDRFYYLLHLFVNFFRAVMKLVSKTRHEVRIHKVYDRAQRLYKCLLNSGLLSEAK